MSLDCPTLIDFWNQLTKTLHKLLRPHPLQEKHILYEYPVLNTVPKQLAIYLIVLAKSTLYKTFSAAVNGTQHNATNYQRMFQLRLQFYLQLEMHHSVLKNGMKTFKPNGYTTASSVKFQMDSSY
jgi:hypothetical protein